ncbi:hypothetical protein AGMMS49938_02880 [Fibrobacterales bacterium]|nr:hypothetical protein AGMMS49938_02880 [Fibrobacterales bacterium]
MEVGKKYALKEFPDSLFLDTLDKFFNAEPLRQQQKQKVEMTMNNDFEIPKSLRPSESRNSSPSHSNMGTNNDDKKSETKQKKQTENEISFLENFIETLGKLAEEPNGSNGKIVKAKEGESLTNLLTRTYGAQAAKIPKFLVENQLKTLNPQVNFSALTEGENILLPKL